MYLSSLYDLASVCIYMSDNTSFVQGSQESVPPSIVEWYDSKVCSSIICIVLWIVAALQVRLFLHDSLRLHQFSLLIVLF